MESQQEEQTVEFDVVQGRKGLAQPTYGSPRAAPDTKSQVAVVVVTVGCARLLRCARSAPDCRLANSRELSLLSRRGRQYAPGDQRGRSPAAWSATWNRDRGPATS